MNAGRVFVVLTLLSALLAGGGLYYLQVYGYYNVLPPEVAAQQVVALDDGSVVPLAVTGAEAIDADSSPIRYRACLTAARPDVAMVPYADPVPLTAPGWFSCFDAAAIGAALEGGTATAYLSQADVPWGVDRVVAFLPDGRAFVWPQINRCGTAVFDGKPLPQGCPPPPAKE